MNTFWKYTLIAFASITIMDLFGLALYSALPLTVLLVVGWRQQKFSKQDLGVKWGKPKDYQLAVGYPLVVMSITVLAITAFKGLTLTGAFKVGEIVIVSVIGIFGAFITEEGFFRGLLWRFSRNAGQSEIHILLYTTIAFSLWHLPVALFELGDGFPPTGRAIYIINVILLGLNWGIIRMSSGSSIVAAASHSVWNAIAYKLFGFGEIVTGIVTTSNDLIYSPEIGVLGVFLNLMVIIYFTHFVIKKQG